MPSHPRSNQIRRVSRCCCYYLPILISDTRQSFWWGHHGDWTWYLQKNRYVKWYDLATTQIISLIYPVMFQVVPEPRRDHHGSWPASRNHASTLIIQSFIHYLPPGSNQSALPVGDSTHPWRRRTDAWLRYGTLQPATLFWSYLLRSGPYAPPPFAP